MEEAPSPIDRDGSQPTHPTVRAGLLMMGVVVVLLVLATLSTVR